MSEDLTSLARACTDVVAMFDDICQRIDQRAEIEQMKKLIAEKLNKARGGKFRGFVREKPRPKTTGNVTELPIRPKQAG